MINHKIKLSITACIVLTTTLTAAWSIGGKSILNNSPLEIDVRSLTTGEHNLILM